MFVKSVKIHNRKTGVDDELNVNGIFIAVGEEPNSKIASKLGVEINFKQLYNNVIKTRKPI